MDEIILNLILFSSPASLDRLQSLEGDAPWTLGLSDLMVSSRDKTAFYLTEKDGTKFHPKYSFLELRRKMIHIRTDFTSPFTGAHGPLGKKSHTPDIFKLQ